MGETPVKALRIILLVGDEHSEAESVLGEYKEADLADVYVYELARRFAAQHAGKSIAIERQEDSVWWRFLWCNSEMAGLADRYCA
jgi:hypothetical protein